MIKYLSGWWFQPLWKILVSWEYYSQHMEKWQLFQTSYSYNQQCWGNDGIWYEIMNQQYDLWVFEDGGSLNTSGHGFYPLGLPKIGTQKWPYGDTSFGGRTFMAVSLDIP